MARFTRIEVFLKMKETGVVPVFFNKEIEVCKQVLKACYKGGIRVFEFVNRGDYAHEIFSELNKYSEKELPEMILGAGSIVEAGTTSLFIQNGTNFIVSPILNEDMARVCNRRKILWSPGCGSLSEIGKAEELGAELVKIFPGTQVGGPSFVAAIKAPCPMTNIMPTGGVDITEENLKKWFDAGVTCVGMGSKLFSKSLIGGDSYDALTQKVATLLNIIKKVRS